jgi:hypothetical protein
MQFSICLYQVFTRPYTDINIMKPSESTDGQPQQQPPMMTKKSTMESDNDYEVMGTLGKGAYGIVSLAEKGGKLYAIKRI